MEKEIDNFITDNCALYNGDCLEIMDMLIEKGVKVDAIIADTPFGTTNCDWDSAIPFDKMWERLNKLIKDNGAIVLFSQVPFNILLGASNIKMLRYEWIWEKTTSTGFLNANKMPLKSHENILVFYKKLPTYNPQKELADKPTHTFTKHTGDGDNYGKTVSVSGGGSYERFPKDIITFKTDKQKESYHPTQKPIALMEYLIKTYTNEGELVLDFTMGSGTTCVAARNTNRKSIGIELEKKYFDIAVSRYTDEEIIKDTKKKGLKLASWKKK